jgi:hypothetical protein
MNGALPPLPHMPSWRAAQLKAQGQPYPLPLPVTDYEKLTFRLLSKTQKVYRRAV